jgi:uracil-DNA glycosylase
LDNPELNKERNLAPSKGARKSQSNKLLAESSSIIASQGSTDSIHLMNRDAYTSLNEQISACKRCPRLITHCNKVARERKAAYRDQSYWGKPVPNFGDPLARVLIVGLAPGAHGANRTGRMFTGDRSGDWLYRALFRAGFARQVNSIHREDGQELIDCLITAVCHCAPPDNKPLPEEVNLCQPWLDQLFDQDQYKVFVGLGNLAWQAIIRQCKRRNWLVEKAPKFGHDRQLELGSRKLIASYHPSQQNTFTGRLTEPMLDSVFSSAREWIRYAPVQESTAPG